MAKQKKRRGSKWIDPNKVSGKKKYRYCKICGSTAQQVRIMKHENICEKCAARAAQTKSGQLACKACGKVVPNQVQKYNGYCKECVCKICGQPDPEYTKKHGFCRQCLAKMGTNCRICGKEAVAQVRKNNGLCDQCQAEAEKQAGRKG